MNDKTPRYPTGAVVRWNGSLWIVSRSTAAGVCELLSFASSNFTATPSMTWPYVKAYADQDGPADHSPDRTRTSDTIIAVADSVSAFIIQRATRAFFDDCNTW